MDAGFEIDAQYRVGNSPGTWTLDEIVTRQRGYDVANLHNSRGETRIHVPLSEIIAADFSKGTAA